MERVSTEPGSLCMAYTNPHANHNEVSETEKKGLVSLVKVISCLFRLSIYAFCLFRSTFQSPIPPD
jgi:hypothetical protein